MGLASYGRPTLVEQVNKVIRRTDDGAFALDLDYFEFHTTVGALLLGQVHRAVRAAPRSVRADRSRDRRGPPLRRHRGQRPARARGHARGDHPRAPPGDRAVRPLPRRRRGPERLRQRAHPGRVGLRADLRAARAGRRGLRARRRAVRRPHPLRQPGSRGAGPPVLGAVDRRRRARARRRGGRPRRRRSSPTTRPSSSASPRTSRRTAWSAGWKGPWSSGRARSATAASSPRRTTRRCAIGSTATSSTARSSAPSRRWSPSRRPSATSSCRPGGAGSRASCRACSRCGQSGASGSPPSRTSTGRRGSRSSIARCRRASTRCSRPTGVAAASRCCSTPRSISPASRSSTAPSRGTRRSAAAASTCWSPGRHAWSQAGRGPSLEVKVA